MLERWRVDVMTSAQGTTRLRPKRLNRRSTDRTQGTLARGSDFHKISNYSEAISVNDDLFTNTTRRLARLHRSLAGRPAPIL